MASVLSFADHVIHRIEALGTGDTARDIIVRSYTKYYPVAHSVRAKFMEVFLCSFMLTVRNISYGKGVKAKPE